MALPHVPAERHRVVAERFAALTRAVSDWDAPTPVPAWAARDVVGHLLDWFAGFLESSSEVRLPDVPPHAEDPVAAWRQRSDDIQAVLDDPETGGRRLTNPHLGELPLADAIDRFYTTDVFLHSWDLARASGQDDSLDEDLATELLAGMQQMEEALRASGHYGPAVEVPGDAPITDRLMAFIGRDPGWRPPSG